MTPTRRASLGALVIVGVLLLPAAIDAGQGTRATVSGHATTVDGRDAAGVVVRTLDGRGLTVADARTDDRGRFHVDAVAVGTYSLVADTADERARAVPLAVETAYPIELDIRLAPRIEASAVVRAGLESPAVTARATLSGDAIRQAPARLGSRALQQALATMPGWSIGGRRSAGTNGTRLPPAAPLARAWPSASTCRPNARTASSIRCIPTTSTTVAGPARARSVATPRSDRTTA